jgi:CRISPR-associated endonuclease/helicase Cas3
LNDQPSYFRYWGKAQISDNDGPGFHLLPYHCLDVAAVGHTLLQRHLPLRDFLSSACALEPQSLTQWAPFFFALHDLGKFSQAFQGQRPEILQHLQGTPCTKPYDERHDSLGFLLWRSLVQGELFKEPSMAFTRDATPMWREWFKTWLELSNGHHGAPPRPLTRPVSRYFSKVDTQASLEFAIECARLLLPTDGGPQLTLPIGEVVEKRLMSVASWWLAGAAVLSDWIGSNRGFFQYQSEPMPLGDYWLELALPSAAQALDAAEILPIQPAEALAFTDLFEWLKEPTPVQAEAARLSISPEPQLFLIEDLTGAGKTEAAYMLLHRLMSQGCADGFYFALPTMATANAIYERSASVYTRLYSGERAPSLILAHGARHLSKTFTEAVLPAPAADTNYGKHETSAGNHCAEWLADNKKKALLAHAGVGTIDQAVLAILTSRHQALRLLGLRGKVLVVDEVHASDAYLHKLLRVLLTFHAAAGGSAILLSATLPQRMRSELVAAFREGLGQTTAPLSSRAYPLVTHVTRAETAEHHTSTRPSVKRSVDFRLISDEQAAIAEVAQAVQTGKGMCWVRNTVQDAIRTYDSLCQTLGPDRVTLFHARFALIDRLATEHQVLDNFGPQSGAAERAGQAVVATQVVEQSLDLDFDEMISDLAPVDLLIQRAGRLRRHTRDNQGNRIDTPDERGNPELVVLSPDPTADARRDWFSSALQGASFVYPNHGQLWLTARLAQQRKTLRMPEDLRDWIDTVYGDGADGRVPEALRDRSVAAQGQAIADSNLARANTVRLMTGYHRDIDNWWEDTLAPTRLGEPAVTLRLIRLVGQDLRPWAQEASHHRWAHSEVNIRLAMVSGSVVPQDPELGGQIAELVAQWPGGHDAAIPVVLSADDTGVWRGQALNQGGVVEISYTKERGLQVER